MSALTNLQAKYVADAASLTDTVEQLQVLADIETWAAARTALDALTASNLSSYSIAGRSVTRRDVPSLQNQEREVHGRILTALYGRGVMVADLRYPLDETE
jgi:hypothetical protein